MTLANQNSTVTATGNGVTTEWPYTFKIPTDADLNVGLFTIATGVLTTLNPSAYSVTGLGTDDGGEVTYPLVGSPITSATRLVIWREVSYTQDIDLTNQSPYYSETLEDQLDKMVMQVQQLSEETSRAFKVTLGSDSTPDELVELLTESAVIAVAAAGTATTQAGNAATSAGTATTEAADAAQSATDAENFAISIAQAAVMVGSTQEWNGPVPAGWLRFREGGTFNRATFPDLATFWDANGSFWGMTAPQIASGQFPDTRDYVSRHAGGALGPAVGAKQADAFQGHWHETYTFDNAGLPPTSGNQSRLAQGTNWNLTARDLSGNPSSREAVSDTVNGTPRTATETRVKSFGVRYIIKASSAATNQGLVDMLALATSVTNLENHAIRDDVDQGAQAKLSAFKVNILKNTLQAWEQIGGVVDLAGLALADWTNLGGFRFLRLVVDATNGTTSTAVAFRVSQDNGASFNSGGSNYAYQFVYATSSTITASGGTTSYGPLSASSFGNIYGYSLWLNIGDWNKARLSYYDARASYLNAAALQYNDSVTGYHNSALVNNALRIYPSVGVFSAGAAILQGMRG